MALVEAKKIEGVSVYGVQMVSYTVAGVAGQDYTQALTAACFKESLAVDAELQLVASMVRLRQTKLQELGNVMSILTYAKGTMPVKEPYQTDLSEPIDALPEVSDVALKYFIRIPLAGDGGNRIQRRNCEVAISSVKHAIDMESNSMQQDTVTLQNLIGKRDSTYQTASSITKKSLNASASSIKNMRG